MTESRASRPDPLVVPSGFQPLAVDAYPYDLGPWSRPISTRSKAAQTWFDRGLLWTYGFNHEEAVRCFQSAVLADPTCSMAYWGFAYARGPNYNRPFELFAESDLSEMLKSCHRALELAIQHAGNTLEKGLAEALIRRFPKENNGDFVGWTKSWGDEMQKVYKEFGHDDLDITAVYADSRMNIAAWRLWDIPTGKPNEEAHVSEVHRVLQHALLNPKSKTHAGVLHLWIHLMELSPTPEVAIVPGDLLRDLIPDSGHLHHMPTHIDVVTGDYRRAIASNARAMVSDIKYARMTSDSDFYTFYRIHNMHFLIYAAMFNGQYSHAIEAVDRLEEALPERILRSGGHADWMETFNTVRIHVYVRFGKWDEILALALPHDQELYSITTAHIHYGRGIAHSVLGNIKEAEKEQRRFHEAWERIQPTRMDWPNKSKVVLGVGEAMLAGELEYRKGNHDVAFQHLREAIKRSDNLVYAEPWGWMQPPRHAYAALLLEQGHVSEAAEVYAADLGYDSTLPRSLRHPHNVWALHGYHECLKRLGKEESANIVKVELDVALAVSDVKVESSCYCRKVDDGKMACCL
jgi:tetratricopeptide (TPR) repeat protein